MVAPLCLQGTEAAPTVLQPSFCHDSPCFVSSLRRELNPMSQPTTLGCVFEFDMCLVSQSAMPVFVRLNLTHGPSLVAITLYGVSGFGIRTVAPFNTPGLRV